MTKNIKRRKTYNKSRRVSKNEIDGFTAGIVLLVLFLYKAYMIYIKPNIEAIKYYGTIAGIILVILGVVFLVYRYKKRKKAKLIEQYRISNIPDFIKDLDSKISGYKPLRYHSKEEPYQMELAGFLRNHFETLDIEVYKNNSRPDIIIDEIAIEIKGPTNKGELKTIPDKIIRYLKERDYLFIVLFKVEVDEDYYKEWKGDIYNTFENKKDKIYIINL